MKVYLVISTDDDASYTRRVRAVHASYEAAAADIERRKQENERPDFEFDYFGKWVPSYEVEEFTVE